MNVSWHAALLGVFLFVCACNDGAATQVVLVVEADARTRQLSNTLRVLVYDDSNQLVLDETHPFGGNARIPLVPLGNDASRRYRVVIEALGDDATVIVRAEAQGGYEANEKVERAVPLNAACHFIYCGAGLSCGASGRCEANCAGGDCVDDPHANAVFVDNVRGADTNDCTQEATPCATFEAATSQLGPGTKRVFVFGAEPYPTIKIGSGLSGASASPTIIQSWGETRARVQTTGAEMASLHFREASHILVSGFEIEGSVQYGVAVEGSEDVTISGNLFVETSYAAAAGNASGVLVDGDSTGVTVSGNQIDGQRSSSSIQAHGVAVEGTDTRVLGNDLSNNDSFGLIGYGNFELVAAYNRISGNTFDGVGLFPGSLSPGATLANNWICANNTHGVSANQLIDIVSLRNNTFFSNNVDAFHVYDNNTRGTAVADNNLFVENGGFAIAVEAGEVRGVNNGFVRDTTDGNFMSDQPETNTDVTAPTFENASDCRLNAPELPLAPDGSRIGAL